MPTALSDPLDIIETIETIMRQLSSSTDLFASPSPGSEVSIEAAAYWTTRRLIMATLTVVGVAMTFLLLYQFYMVVFLFFVAVSLQVAIEPAVGWFYRYGIPKQVGVIVVYILLLVLIGLLIWFVAPLLIEQGQAITKDLPQYYQQARTTLLESGIGLVRGIGAALPAQPAWLVREALTAAEATPATPAPGWQAAQVGSRTLFAIFAIFVLAFYWTQESEVILRRLVLQASPARRTELRALIAEIEGKIGSYFRGQFILCVIVGALSTVAFVLIGVPNAILLGLLMGIFEAIPILGPTLGAVPAVLMTLATDPGKIFWVIGALIFIQAAENNLLVPRIMDKSVGVNAVVSMLAITAFGALFGLAGAILAIPLAAILQILLDRLLFNTPIADEPPLVTIDTSEVSRSHVGVLRLEAQEVMQAVRKQARQEQPDVQPDTAAEQTEDEIEALAVELDGILAQLEGNAA
jgi:predicted PurR-regulated permease PerM